MDTKLNIGHNPFLVGSVHTARLIIYNPTEAQWTYRVTLTVAGVIALEDWIATCWSYQSQYRDLEVTMPSAPGTYPVVVSVWEETTGQYLGEFPQENVTVEAPLPEPGTLYFEHLAPRGTYAFYFDTRHNVTSVRVALDVTDCEPNTKLYGDMALLTGGEYFFLTGPLAHADAGPDIQSLSPGQHIDRTILIDPPRDAEQIGVSALSDYGQYGYFQNLRIWVTYIV